jgi:dihydrofolate reductase
MTRLRVQSFAISIDGYGAGPHQDLANPIGINGTELFQWFFATPTFQKMHGDGGTTDSADTGGATADIDDAFAQRGFANVGAWILGRNMFGPVRGPWLDESWRGWWGDSPPYKVPVFVLTHHSRPSIAMQGGTVFHFVTEGIHAALSRATEAANGQHVRLGGGVATIRQYLRAGLIDEFHLAISPVVLGSGEHLLDGIDLRSLGYRCTEHAASNKATHVVLTRNGTVPSS